MPKKKKKMPPKGNPSVGFMKGGASKAMAFNMEGKGKKKKHA
jgi:hypothetical protein